MTENVDFRGRPRKKYQTQNTKPSLTVQSDGPRADIKKLVARYKKTGIVDHLNRAQLQYLDVTNFNDFQDVMETVATAKSMFMELPPQIREFFNNDPAQWLDAAHDPEKRTALVEAGYIAPPESGDPTPTPDAPSGTSSEEPGSGPE